MKEVRETLPDIGGSQGDKAIQTTGDLGRDEGGGGGGAKVAGRKEHYREMREER